ncbi:hypothetical protein [Streptomyces griseus]|uniref:COG1470 family protein n=1 Tax=Streptomyces griseus TaxID=1911 RepID=UPI00056999FD|nr:hypothetical protein [Streptomyces griseus]
MSFAARVLFLAALCALGPIPAAGAADGWSLAPSGGGRPSFYAEGVPGADLRDTVSVTNRNTRPVTVRLTATGAPVTFAEAAVRIPARTRADIPFTVRLPADRATGDRTGAIVARDADGRHTTVRLLLRTGGPKLAALTVEHVAVRGDRITYELVDRGTTALTPRLEVRADGVLGRVLDRAPRTLPVELAPGSRLRLTEPWPDPPALDAVDVRLTATAAGGARETAQASARFVPWDAVAGTAAAALLAGTAVAVRRRGRRKDERAVPESPSPEAGFTGAVG